jgi:hypothetical protein
MSSIHDKIDEFYKSAEEDSNNLYKLDLPGKSNPLKKNPEDVLNQREFNDKYRELKLIVLEIKRLADIVDYKYKNVGPAGPSKFIDFDFWGTLWDLKKVRKILTNRAEKLDKFFVF